MGLKTTALQQEPADFANVFAKGGIIGFLPAAAPQADFVERDYFLFRVAGNHGAQAAAADRQGLQPVARRPLEP